MNRPMPFVKLTLIIACCMLVSGCWFENVKPWHREFLAPQKAQLVPDALENEADQHVYFSKEAASGGEGVGGGGCGCN